MGFGEFDFVDSIKGLQDGTRTRFPIELNGELLSFESDNPEIKMENLLSIFVNGVLLEPGSSYTFEGGTTFDFKTPPDADDDISVFFYKGTSGGSNPDTRTKDVPETLKTGDVVEIGATQAILWHKIQELLLVLQHQIHLKLKYTLGQVLD